MKINTIELFGGTKARAKDVNDNVNILKNAIYALEEDMSVISQKMEELKRKPTREMFDVYFSVVGESPTGAYPLWTGEWVNHCKSIYPDFYAALKKKAGNSRIKAVTNTEYEEILEEYGQCGAFVIDELNGHVRLPKITRFISSIEDLTDLGDLEHDEVKNHKHFLLAVARTSKKANDTSTQIGNDSNGGLNHSDYTLCKTEVPATVALSSTPVNMVDEENVLRGSDENMVKHIKLALYIQLANNVTDIAEMNTEIIAQMLSDAIVDMNAQKDRILPVIAERGEYYLNEIEQRGGSFMDSVGDLGENAVAEISSLKQDNIAAIENAETVALAKIETDRAAALAQINTSGTSLLGQINTSGAAALGQIDVALQNALAQLSATELLQKIDQALTKINGGY
jgi:hypothetical protein